MVTSVDQKTTVPAGSATRQFCAGDVYADEAPPRLFRVLYVDQVQQSAWLIALGENAQPFSDSLVAWEARAARGELTWTINHAFRPRLLPPKATRITSSMSRAKNAPRHREKELRLIEHHSALLGPLCECARNGTLYKNYGQMIAARAEELGASRTTVRRVLRKWLEGGMKDSALGSTRHLCGGKGSPKTYVDRKPGRKVIGEPHGVPLNPDILQALAWGAQWLRKNPHRLRVDGFNAMNEEFFAFGETQVGEVKVSNWIEPQLRPTESQFARYCRKHVPELERKRGRRGNKHFRQNVAPIFETTSGRSFGPGSMSHLDSSPMPIRLVNSTRTMDIGQPRLYFVIDDFSSVITGSWISFAEECTADALTAVAISMVGFIRAPRATKGCRQQPDIEKFVTQEGFTDKGSGYLSDLSDSVYQRMGARVSNPEGGMPNQRGKGEQRFNMAGSFHDWMPGAISKRHRGRGSKKRGADAALTVAEYQKAVDEFILFHNSTHRPPQAPIESFLPDGSLRTAFDLLVWGISHRGAPNRCSADEVRLCLYPQMVATVDGHGGGLKLDGLFYRVLGEPPERLDFTRSGGRAKGEWIILRDPNRIGSAWLLVDDGTSSLELEVTGQSRMFAELSAPEWETMRKNERDANRKNRPNYLLLRAASNAHLSEIAKTAMKLRGRKSTAELPGKSRTEETQQGRQATNASLLAAAAPVSISPTVTTSNVIRPTKVLRLVTVSEAEDDNDDYSSLASKMYNDGALK